MKRVRVASKLDVPPDQLLAVEVEGEQIALCQAYGHYYAVSDTCTHEGSSLSNGYMEENRIVCDLHGAEFDPRTGKALKQPAHAPLKTYRLVEVGEDLYIEMEEE